MVPSRAALALAMFVLVVPATSRAVVLMRNAQLYTDAGARATGGPTREGDDFRSDLGAGYTPYYQLVTGDPTNTNTAIAFPNMSWDPTLGVGVAFNGLLAVTGSADGYARLVCSGEVDVVGTPAPYQSSMDINALFTIWGRGMLYQLPGMTPVLRYDTLETSVSASRSGTLPVGHYWFLSDFSAGSAVGSPNNFGGSYSLAFTGYDSQVRIVSPPPGTIVNLALPVPTLTLPVTETSSPTPVSRQWLRNGVPIANGGKVSGATSDTLVITNFSTADSAVFSVVITNGAGSDTSDIAVCEADHVSSVPRITGQPVDQPLDGSANTFSVRAFASGPLTWQWRRSGVPLVDGPLPSGASVAGSSTPILALFGPTSAELGDYSCLVTDAAGSTLSRTAHLYSGTTAVAPSAPGLLRLEAHPVPAFTAVTMSFSLPTATPARLELFDLAGRRVATPLAATLGPGLHGASWDLRDDQGSRVPAGVYLARVSTGNALATRRIVVIE